MLMVIFGAGASYDSISTYEPKDSDYGGGRPPLAKHLFLDNGTFRRTLAKFARCHPIIPYLEAAGDENSLEEVLGQLDAEAQTDTERKRQLLSVRFYLRSIIEVCESQWCLGAGGISNYKTLLDQTRRFGSALLVTFNYDTLLERALSALFFRKFDRMSDYIDPSGFSVLKLHGSTDWVQIVTGAHANGQSPSDDEIIESAASLEVHTVIHRSEQGKSSGNPIGQQVIPALAIPIAQKREFMCPDSHLTYLQSALPNVTKIIIIGWRASEAHFTQMLRENLSSSVEVIAVCGSASEGEKSLQRLKDAGVSGSFTPLPVGFTGFIKKRLCESFIAH